MARPRRLLVLVAVALVGVACNAAPIVPSPSAAPSGGPLSSPPSEPSAGNPSPAAAANIGGPWLASPIPLADSQVAIVSDACAAAARDRLGPVEADLPTAVVDARGAGRFTAILSDGGAGIDCFGKIGDAGATVDAVDRLAVDAVEPVDGAAVAITELAVDEDDAPRTVAYGRIGPDGSGVRLSRADGSAVTATVGTGWWAAWWPTDGKAAKVEALDASGAVAASVPAPASDVESRLSTALWWLDPAKPRPTESATTLDVLVQEQACASGQSGVDRIDPPSMELDDTTVTVRLDIRRRAGGQDCQAIAPFPFTVELPEPLGNRRLLGRLDAARSRCDAAARGELAAEDLLDLDQAVGEGDRCRRGSCRR